MVRKLLVLCVVMLMGATAAYASVVPSQSTTDLWDISQGSTVTGSSDILWHGYDYYSDANNMFGGTGGTLGNVTYFEDDAYYTGPQWITWSTSAPVILDGFNLFSNAYGTPRSFGWFKLYADDFNTPIYTFTPTTSFNGILSETISPITAQSFKAEFGRTRLGGDWNSSTVIAELDGNGRIAPEPVSSALFLLGGAALAARRIRRKS